MGTDARVQVDVVDPDLLTSSEGSARSIGGTGQENFQIDNPCAAGVIAGMCRDAYQLGLPKMASWPVAASTADLEPFQAHHASRRAADRRTLVRALPVPGCGGCSTTGRGEPSALADSALHGRRRVAPRRRGPDQRRARTHQRVVRGWHLDVRLVATRRPARAAECGGKDLRYTLELFTPVLDNAHREGDQRPQGPSEPTRPFQDSEVQRITLRVSRRRWSQTAHPPPRSSRWESSWRTWRGRAATRDGGRPSPFRIPLITARSR